MDTGGEGMKIEIDDDTVDSLKFALEGKGMGPWKYAVEAVVRAIQVAEAKKESKPNLPGELTIKLLRICDQTHINEEFFTIINDIITYLKDRDDTDN